MLVTGYPLVSYDVPWSVLSQTAAPTPDRKGSKRQNKRKSYKLNFTASFTTCCRRIKTNLSFDGDAETIDGSLGAVSLTKDASSETDAGFCIGHFNPLDVVTIERTNWNKADVMLFTTDDDQQLLFWQIINLVDAFALTDPSDFCSENNTKKRNFKSNRLEPHQMRNILLSTFTIEVNTK